MRHTLGASPTNITLIPTFLICAYAIKSQRSGWYFSHTPVHRFCSHPPLGKLVFYYVGLFTGYDYRNCNYANIADDFGKGAV